MSNQEETGVLKYGDIIKLQCDDQYLIGKGLTYQSLEWSGAIKNGDQCLSAFRVLPKSINLIQTELLQSAQNSDSKETKMNSESLRLEIMNNIHHYSKAIGTAVTVGSNIELQHLLTNKYLGVQMEISSSSSNEFLKFKLKENPDETCLIRLEPVFNFQKERSKVMDGDKVYFEIWISKLNAPIYMYKSESKVCASFENKSRVQLVLTCEESESEHNSIFTWNYVFIKDSENNMSLSVSESIKGKDEEFDVVFTNDIDFDKCLWRIESDLPTGIAPDGRFRLRHITKKLYLSLRPKTYRTSSLFSKIVESDELRHEKSLEIYLLDYDSPALEWTISPINQIESKFIKSQYCTLRNEDYQLYLSMDYLQMEKCYPSAQKNVSDNIYFQIFKCNEEISTDVAYADEIICRLKEVHGLRNSKSIIKILRVLEEYLLNKNFSIASEGGFVGEVSKFRQDILRNQKIIDVLNSLLGTFLENFQVSGDTISLKVPDKFRAKLEPESINIKINESKPLVKKIFQILVLLTKDNVKNKLEVIRISQTLKDFIKWDVEISRNLVDIVKDFREGHQKYSFFIHELILEHVKLIEEKGLLEYVEFLLHVAVVHGQGMTTNQDLILKTLIVDKDVFEIPLCESNVFRFRDNTSLEDRFYINRTMANNPFENQKFLKLLQILVYLCEGRNYNCIEKVKDKFPFESMSAYIDNENIDYELRALFLTLISKAYIDIAPRFEKEYPNHVIDDPGYNLQMKKINSIRKVSPYSSADYINPLEDSQFLESKQNWDEFEKFKIFLIEKIKSLTVSVPSSEDELYKDTSFSVFKLGILRNINLLVKLGMFNPSDKVDEVQMNDQTKLIRDLTKLIKHGSFFESDLHHNTNTKEKKSEANLEFLRKQKEKRNTVLRYSTRVLNFINQKLDSEEKKSDLNEDCIIEILQSISFYLNWRQDRMIKEYFSLSKSGDDNFQKKFLENLPPVIKQGMGLFASRFSIISEKLLCNLLDLVIKTKRYEVKSLALSIFIRSFYVLRETVSNIDKIEFLHDQEDIEVHKRLKKYKREFVSIAEGSEIWIPDPEDSRYLRFLTILKDFSSLLTEKSSFLNQVVLKCSDSVSKTRQNIFFNLKIHIIMMKFISDSVYFVEKFPQIIPILKQAYNIITLIIKNNKPHQEYFKKHLKLFLSSLQYDLGQIETICEIYLNNYELCNSVDLPFIHQFIECILKYGRQGRFLKIFQIIQIVDKEPILDIQLKVMNCLLDRENYKYLCYCTGDTQAEFIFDQVHLNDEPYTYHTELFKVFSKSTAGILDVEINESKCKKLLDLTQLFKLVYRAEHEADFSVMLIPLLELFYDVYLDSKQRTDKSLIENHIIGIIERCLACIKEIKIEHFNIIVKILRKYSEIYSLRFDANDEISGCVERFLRVVADRREIVKEEFLFENYDDLDHLFKTFDMYFNFQKKTEDENPTFVFNDHNLKNITKTELNLKLKKKEERSQIATVILKATDQKSEAKQKSDLKQILNELLQIIKYYKIRKISKKTVFLCILILKTLVIHEDENQENKTRIILEDLNAIGLILQILSEKDTESSIFQKLLVFLIKILKKGTTETQNLFYNHFINNQESEVFFKSLTNILLRFKPFSKGITEVSLKPICRTLEMAKLLCENHNTQLQNYLRNQDKSLISYNFINTILILLENLIKLKEIVTYKAAGLCIDTLTEMCQGPCKENQRAVIDSNFVEIMNEFLAIDQREPGLPLYEKLRITKINYVKENLLKEGMVTNLKYKSLLTLHSVIEGNEDMYILSRMLRTINIEVLYQNMVSVYTSSQDKSRVPQDKPKEKIFLLEVGILVYHLLRIFQDNPTNENRNVVKNLLPEVNFDKGDFNYLGKEIDMNEASDSVLKLPSMKNKNNRVSPLNPPEDNFRKKFEEAAKYFELRTGNIDVVLSAGILCKIYFWLDLECSSLSEDMKYDFHYNADRSSDKNKLEYLLSRVDDVRDHIEHEYLISRWISDYRIMNFLSKIIIWKILAFLTSIVLFGMTLNYYEPGDSVNFTLSMLTADEIVFRCFHALEIIHIISSIMIVIFYYLKSVPVIFKKAKRSDYALFRDYLLFKVIYVYLNLETIYVSLYLVFSALGCFYHIFFFAFHLLDFLYLFPILQSVIISVIQPWKSIVLLLCLIVIVMYIFSLLSYVYFSSFFSTNCDSLLMCTYISVLEGVKNSGGVGYYTYWEDLYWGDLRFTLFLFDNINNIVIFIILWNILTGTIINAFAIIRYDKENNLQDQISKCFICGIKKDEIEEITKKPFKFHRKYEHNEWNYIFFIIYLEKKKKEEYSGIESIIKKEVEQKSINWIPQGRGFSLSKV